MEIPAENRLLDIIIHITPFMMAWRRRSPVESRL